MSATESPASAVFQLCVSWPKSVVAISLLLIASALFFLPQLVKDMRSDAFLARDNPALIYRDKVKEQFGLSDPLVITVVHSQGEGVFKSEVLELVAWLSEEISLLPNVNESRITSLATEKNITGSEEGMDVIPFLESMPESPAESAALRLAINDFPLYLGSLVSRTGQATVIVAEMLDESEAEATYFRVLDVIERAPKVDGVDLHVAGEGAIIGYLGRYVDADAQRLIPITALIITLVIVFAYRRLSPALLSNVVITASIVISMGVMVANGISFFVVTNALPVILIGISVADSIHVYSHFFDIQSQRPDSDTGELIVETMEGMWRPITLTSLTTIAGFLGLYFAAYMPPFKYFGLFAALGVMVAWFYSLLFLPAAIMLTKPSQDLTARKGNIKDSVSSRGMNALGRFTNHYARSIITCLGLVCVLCLYTASKLVVDENAIGVFHPDEPVARADRVINQYMNGSNTLDIVVEASEVEGLFEPSNLLKIETLQKYALTLEHVQGSSSIVDYLKQINRALTGGASDAYQLPDSSDLVAQYFLIYTATSDPTDFESLVDYDYQTANIRVDINSGGYQDVKVIVEELQTYLDSEFNSDEIKATLTGRVSLHYHWIKDLAASHFKGLAIALLMVWLVSSLLFRSLLAGTLALLPVACSVLIVYASMVVLGIPLGMGTSMFAAVAIGLGIDFAIHTLDRLKVLYKTCDGDMDKVFSEFYPSTGLALFFNCLAIACGFGVLMFSKIASLNNFGSIVLFSVVTSFIVSMTLLPALVKVFRPRFIITGVNPSWAKAERVSGFLFAVIALSIISYPANIDAAEPLTADEIVARVNAVDDGQFLTRKLKMELTDKRGKTRERETISYRKYYGKDMRTVLFYLSPANVRNTGFLIWDYAAHAEDDDQWLYLPALRKVRRISSSDRGDAFLGTDFSYEDIKLDGKWDISDYNFSLMAVESMDGIAAYKLSAIPKTAAIAKELGYGKTEFWVDKSNWMVLKVDFWNVKQNSLKTMIVEGIRQVDGIWTRSGLHILNHKTGHQTQFTFSDVDYKTPVKDSWFTKRALSRGH